MKQPFDATECSAFGATPQPPLPKSARHILDAILGVLGGEDRPQRLQIGVRRLAELAGVSYGRAQRAILLLKERGVIRVIERGTGPQNPTVFELINRDCNRPKPIQSDPIRSKAIQSDPLSRAHGESTRVGAGVLDSFSKEKESDMMGWDSREAQDAFVNSLRDKLRVPEMSRHAASWMLAHHTVACLLQAGASLQLISDVASSLAERGIANKPPAYLAEAVRGRLAELSALSKAPEPQEPRHDRAALKSRREPSSRVYVTAPDGHRMEAGGMLAAAIRLYGDPGD